MTAYDEHLIALIQQQIRLSQRASEAAGTVVSRATTGSAAMVLFDGSSTPMPVKVPGSVFCQPNDRVLLNRYGSDWVVTNAYVGPGFGEASRFLSGLSAATGNLSSTSFVDLSEFGSVTFTKFYDATFVQVTMMYSGYVSVAGCEIEWGVRMTPTSGGAGYTPVDTGLGTIFFNSANFHLSQPGSRRVLNLPAGTYTVAARWRMATVAGAGTGKSDTQDTYWLQLDERVRAGASVL